jgi:hypothetical protein
VYREDITETMREHHTTEWSKTMKTSEDSFTWSEMADLEDVESTAIINGRIIERKRIMAMLKDEFSKLRDRSEWATIGIIELMQMIEEEELKHED